MKNKNRKKINDLINTRNGKNNNSQIAQNNKAIERNK